MKYMIYLSVFMICISVVTMPVAAQQKANNKYVGVKICAPCHKTEKSGNQFAIWQKTKHAEAYKVLTTAKADEIAKAKGTKKPAAESPECLECHAITADTKMVEKSLDPKDGVQCEVCHGAGSAYKTISTMKDKAKSVAAGMTEYKDDAAIEKKCRTCHNEKSPTYKEFKFQERWPKIKHQTPKKS